ncbi:MULTISPECIES: tetratricopeptide repeat protein [unclassified Methanoregula]|uniref:tetratricopeptide repeat protein n=1 Tax=unclassified Methanoregula TaxID=2649730 RepID=UPI0009C6E60C|nr:MULTISPECIES: tetratricopeptide repeat protein [unclassified Methanoregula]OPX64313.1 MAG: Tetratricopeptide repeat protein [Methanoregula sp. PtaB.Bin085]OPY33562.1 MAG: Tetratricopeptide repeat protein [Methanoregula sp. PtaU1.Bin006]
MKPYNTAGVPLEAQYLYRRGRDLMDQQKEDFALAYLRQAVFIAPGFSKAYLDLGNCLARLGRMDEALVYYHKASRIDPVNGGNPTAGTALNGREGSRPIPGSCLSFLVR